jgi:hypothetical protein
MGLLRHEIDCGTTSQTPGHRGQLFVPKDSWGLFAYSSLDFARFSWLTRQGPVRSGSIVPHSSCGPPDPDAVSAKGGGVRPQQMWPGWPASESRAV